MTGKRDYYEVLGVARTASDDEIKRAYRRLAKQYHPDRNPNDRQAEAKFKEVQQAYSVLKDSAKRAQYDRYGEVGVGEWGSGPQGQQVYHWGGSSVNVDDLEELFSRFGQGGGPASIFEELFGGSFARNRGARRRDAGPSRGEDQTQVIDLSFEQAARGATLSLRLAPAGRGSSESIEVKIPPGVENGQRLRLKGRVPGVRGGPPGDLYLQCNIQPHPYFTRNNADIMVEVPVSVVEATLGGSIDVPTLEGPVTMTLPPGTASGTRLRLKRRGIATGTGDRGDQLVTIKIQPPQNLTDAQRRLFESLRESGLPEVRASVPWARAKTR